MKNLNKVRILSILFLLSVLLIPIYALFDHVDWGGRSVGIGLGCVGSGYSVGGEVVMWNVGGLVFIDGGEVSGMYGMPFIGLSGIDMRYSMLALGKNLGGVQAVGLGVGMFDGAGVWSEGEYVIGYSRLVMDSKLGVGISVKYMEYKVKLDAAEYNDDPLLSKAGKGVVSGDIGLVYKLNSNLNIGLVVKDVLNPSISLGGEEEKLGMSYLGGINYVTGQDVKVVYSLGFMSSEGGTDYSLGLEAWLSGGRVGIRGSYSNFRYALGASYNLEKLRVDYTYAIPSQLTDTSGSHYVGVALRF